MPGGDRTGPLGTGPRTGRAAGFCVGYDVPGYANPGSGYGFRGGFGRGSGYGGGFGYGRGGGFGRGGGRGWRHRFYATGLPGWARSEYGYAPAAPAYHPPVESRMAPHDELKMLRNEAKECEGALAEIKARIDELEQERAKMREERS